ncbi:VSP with INR [Giardia lamblia P15]|uniref:VSP with INR n=1 Tax=Giardia intestinalis (strain P15) TaxID=658858 RepID=E1F7D7_GIAIA|nr:VSP with INR [Giardia lamblia P15]
MLLIVFYFVLSAFAADCNGGEASVNCEGASCEMIGDTQICTSCETGFVPINGRCQTKDGVTDKCTDAGGTNAADQTCKKCKGQTFMHKGGCYDKEGEVGRTICKTPGNTEGVCDGCQDGYFKNSSPNDTKDSCVACTPNCIKCSTADNNKCSKCVDGYFVGAASGSEGQCIKCDDTAGADSYKGVTGCNKCKTPTVVGEALCDECSNGLYLKIVGGKTFCVSEDACKEGTTHFPAIDSTNSNKKICVTCDTTANGGIEDCEKCSLKAASAKAAPIITCSKCKTKKLSPLNDACLENCPAGTYPENNDSISVCVPCHNSCVSCENSNAETSCTACYPGSVLSRTTATAGRCIPECTGEFMAHCAAGQCDGVVGGSKYCKKCDNGYVPINGICTAVGAAGRDASMCTAGDGVCTACKNDYALLSGGCYNTNKVPGNLVCETADGTGKCTMCAANNKKPSGDSCPTCSDGCAKCNDSSACTECLPGYYKGTSQCFKCTANSDNGIEGVENCISCAVPISNFGPVTCYVKKDGTSGGGGSSGGGSTNKSGLSTGAIAGIAVAAIVVVGGLVGFLCWWFLCRGKA